MRKVIDQSPLSNRTETLQTNPNESVFIACCLNMDHRSSFLSYQPDVATQQTKTHEWMDEIKIEEVTVSEMSVNKNASPDGFGAGGHLRVEIVRMDAEDDEIVKEEYRLDDEYDEVEMDEIFYIDEESNETIHCTSNDQQLHANKSSYPQQNMQESALELINAADRLLKCSDFHTDENQQIEADLMAIADQSSPRAPSEPVICIEESSESDVDSFVMIDLTLDHDQDDQEIDRKVANVIEYSIEETNQEQPPMKRKRRRKKATKISNRKKHKCDSCKYSTSNKTNLARHIRTHTNSKPYRCKTCAKGFVRHRALVWHMEIHKQKAMSFKCSNCHRKFLREKAWKSHEMKCKNGLRQYECYLCKAIVYNKNHLLKHVRQHTGETEHCPKCDKTFISKIGLTHHLKKHAELFAFQCTICQQVFSCQDKWKLHESRCRLKQYKCDICNRIFVNKNHMIYHMQTHTGKTFDCSNCLREFRSAIGLKTHKCIKNKQQLKKRKILKSKWD